MVNVLLLLLLSTYHKFDVNMLYNLKCITLITLKYYFIGFRCLWNCNFAFCLLILYNNNLGTNSIHILMN